MPADTPASLSHCWRLGPDKALEAKAQRHTASWERACEDSGQTGAQAPARAPGFLLPTPENQFLFDAWQAALPVLFRSPLGTLKCADHVPWGSSYPVPSSWA